MAEVLVLGSYHMGNPGKDIFNMKADDVLAPKRQAEMRELLDVLARFRPTKIAFEAAPAGPKIKQYQDYLAGKYELGRDERDQIGFRLGKEMGLPKVYGIDIDGEFPYPAVQNYAKAHERDKEIESLMEQVGKMVQDDNDFLKSHTVLQMLLRTNSRDAVRRGLAGYALFAHFGEAWDYAGAELLTEWYRRNMRIHTHLLNIIEPGDRVLVIYGSGHLGLMRQNVQADPTLTLRTIEELAVEKELQGASERLARCFSAKDWEGALKAVDRLMELAESFPDPGVKARTLYNKACVLALAGRPGEAVEAVRSAVASGYVDYDRFEADADFDSIRTDPGFRSIVADLKAKHAPRPLPWDRGAGAPEFSQVFDPVDLPELRDMRREFTIDEVVAGAKDDYDRLKRLASWVSSRWKHSPDQMASKGDPVTILREAKAGGRFICRDYAIVLAGVARAYGMPARVLNLLPKDVETRSESHSVAEVWLEGYRKWVLADGQFGAIGELDGTPLSGLELQAAFAAEKPVICAVGTPLCAEWRPFILRNAFYFKTGDDQRLFERKIGRQLVLVPKGAPDPHKFAGGNESVFEGSVYTSDPESFYAPPTAARRR